MTDKHYEEPEMVDSTKQQRQNTNQDSNFEGTVRGYASRGTKHVTSKLFKTAFWPVVISLFIFFVLLVLFIKLLFWLLPFAAAAVVIALVLFGATKLINAVAGFFKK